VNFHDAIAPRIADASRSRADFTPPHSPLELDETGANRSRWRSIDWMSDARAIPEQFLSNLAIDFRSSPGDRPDFCSDRSLH